LFDEVRAIIGSYDSEDLSDWFVWRDDWRDWQPASNVSGLDEMIYRPMPNRPPETPSKDGGPAGIIQGGLKDDISISMSNIKLERPTGELGEVFDASTSDSFVVRAKKRFRKRYSVSIEINGKIFKTHSRDISVGGVNVEDVIPDWVTGYFKIRLGKSNSKQQIELQCCLVEGQPPHSRYRVQILPLQNESDEANLENWLAA
jgi:hypothetical protein